MKPAYKLTRRKQAGEGPKRYRDFIRTWREEPKALQVFAAGNAMPQPQVQQQQQSQQQL